MKKLFARIGIVLEVSDEEARRILEEAGVNPAGGNCEYDISEEFARRFVKFGKIDGDSYIPADEIKEETK